MILKVRKNEIQAFISRLDRQIDDKREKIGERALAGEPAVFEGLSLGAPIENKLIFKRAMNALKNLVCSLPGLNECNFQETRQFS